MNFKPLKIWHCWHLRYFSFFEDVNPLFILPSSSSCKRLKQSEVACKITHQAQTQFNSARLPAIRSWKRLHERQYRAREGHAKKTSRGLALLWATGQAEKQLSAKRPLWRWLYDMRDIRPVWKSQAVSVADVSVSRLWGWAMQLCPVQKREEQRLSNSLSQPCNATGLRLSVCNLNQINYSS